MIRPKAILFDLDDTIISFDGVSEKTWDICSEMFVRENDTPFSAMELRGSIQKARDWYWNDAERHRTGRANINAARRNVVKTALCSLGYCDEQKAFLLADSYSELHWKSLHLFDGAMEALEIIKSLGIKMALLTNGTSREQRGKIERFDIARFFEAVFIEEEAGFGKPDARAYLNALGKLALRSSDVWMVGDNIIWDVEAPQSLGIFSVWNDCEGKGLPADSKVKPDMIVNNIYELAAELARN